MRPERTLLTAQPFDDDDTPSQTGYLAVTLSETERPLCEGWVKNHLEQIETALADVQGRFEQERNQFEGLMPGGDYPYPGAFRVNVPITKKKVREISNRLKQAYLDSDPIWAIVSPVLSAEQTSQVERGLDQQVDHELEAADDLSQAMFEAVLHGLGVLEAGWAYWEDTVRDLAVYAPFDGTTPDSLMDLFRFEQDYPNWPDDPLARKLHRRLESGRPVRHEVSYRTATLNRPDLGYVPVKDLRCYPHLNDRIDLHRSPCYGYVRTYTRAELEDLAKDGTIDDAVLGRVFGDTKTETETSPREQQEEFQVFQGTIRYRMAGQDTAERYKVWWERESSTILRLRQFPWWLAEPDLVLLHTRQEEPGIFKRGIAWDVRDTHTATNVAFNLYLNGADMANSMRWKTKEGSLAEQHLLAHRWSPHNPMSWKNNPNEVEALATPTSHLGPLVQGVELLRRQSDEETQTTSLQSGRESPTDPQAPATKTIALLQQVEPNTKEYLRSLEPGFRLLGKWILWLFYQGKRLGWIDSVPGFEDVPDEQLMELARQLQPRALLWEFDRGTRLQADNMVLGWVTKLAPAAVPHVLRKAISHVNSDWAKEVDTLPLEAPAALSGTDVSTPPGSPSGGTRVSGLVPSNGQVRSPLQELFAGAS